MSILRHTVNVFINRAYPKSAIGELVIVMGVLEDHAILLPHGSGTALRQGPQMGQ